MFVGRLYPGCGLCCGVHWFPSQCSRSVLPVWLMSTYQVPAAHTSFEATASTPFNRLMSPKLGVLTTLHAVPFQCIASVRISTSTWLPTAHTSFALIAFTPFRSLLMPGLGLDTMLHAVPSQCIVSVSNCPLGLYSPTAHTSFAATPDTLLSTP